MTSDAIAAELREPEPERRHDFIFGVCHVPPDEWWFAFPFFPLKDVLARSYVELQARGDL